jgi:hypothetical protein
MRRRLAIGLFVQPRASFHRGLTVPQGAKLNITCGKSAS